MAQAAAVAAVARVVDKEVAVVTKAAVRRAAAAEADRAAAIANEKPEASSQELAFFWRTTERAMPRRLISSTDSKDRLGMASGLPFQV